ncbi:hypothetical protein FRB91_009086 [Serendipita sp. 411]|nr:hypothetical protein FRB91_009086 [Serendipita sp. 411]
MDACRSGNDAFETKLAPYAQEIGEITTKLAVWRKERLPPPHALQSDFDHAAATVTQMLMGGIAVGGACVFMPHLQTLLPELIGLAEITDNPMLSSLGSAISRMVLSISLPTAYIRPVFTSLVDIARTSTSWRVRHRASSMIPAIFLRYLERWSDTDEVPKMLEVMLMSLEDENVDVRSNGSLSLAVVIRNSMLNKIETLQVRYDSPQKICPFYHIS